MARVTIKNAVEKIGNRFDLIIVATRRARQLQIKGKNSLLKEKNDKITVISLPEIELKLINVKILDFLEYKEQQKQKSLEIQIVSTVAEGRR
ncbi:MAG: DNA-directed RNA polymerase subunit omega [Arsenophonus sp. ET-YP4-MAG3]